MNSTTYASNHRKWETLAKRLKKLKVKTKSTICHYYGNKNLHNNNYHNYF